MSSESMSKGTSRTHPSQRHSNGNLNCCEMDGLSTQRTRKTYVFHHDVKVKRMCLTSKHSRLLVHLTHEIAFAVNNSLHKHYVVATFTTGRNTFNSMEVVLMMEPTTSISLICRVHRNHLGFSPRSLCVQTTSSLKSFFRC